MRRRIEGTDLEVLVHEPTIRQTQSTLDAAGLLTRSYDNDNAAVAARLLWSHLTTCDDVNLERWAGTTVGELVSLVARRGERFNNGEELDE